MITALIFAVIGYLLLAVVSILDKYILTKSVKKPIIYAFYSTIFFLVVFLLVPWSQFLTTGDFIWAIISGLAFGFGLCLMYIGLRGGETSHIAPFIGGIVALATYVFSVFLLNESLVDSTKIGLVFLIVACFLLSFEKSQKYKGFHRGFFWATLAGILFGLSHVTAKHIYEIYPFITGLVWTKGSIGFVGLIILCWPNVFKEIIHPPVLVDNNSTVSKHKIFIIVLDKILGVLGALGIQYAIAVGSVTVVNGLAGIQYVLVFVIIYIFTKLWPKIFFEYFTRREIFMEISAILLIIIGLIYFQ